MFIDFALRLGARSSGLSLLSPRDIAVLTCESLTVRRLDPMTLAGVVVEGGPGPRWRSKGDGMMPARRNTAAPTTRLVRLASRPRALLMAPIFAGRRMRRASMLAAFAGLTWLLGFAFGENSSGGARYDFTISHWPTSLMFADQPFLAVIRDYPSSTTPLFHMLMAAMPWVHDPTAYRLTGFAIGTATLVIFGIAVHARFAKIWPDASVALLASGAVALSPGFRSAAFWGNTDVLPVLLTALVVLLLHDPDTGTWRAHTSLGRVVTVALVSAAAFYTRQLYAFLPVFSFWIMVTRTQVSRLLLCLIFGITAIPGLFLLQLWHGLNPPLAQAASQRDIGLQIKNLISVGALAAPFALPFLFARPAVKRPPKAAIVAVIAGVCLFLLAFQDMVLLSLGGGVVTKIGLLLGPAGVPFVLLLSACGWWAIGTLLVAGLDDAIVFGLAIVPLLIMPSPFQRYLDPLAFVLLLLVASPTSTRRLVTERSVLAGYFFFMGLEMIGLVWYGLLRHDGCSIATSIPSSPC